MDSLTTEQTLSITVGVLGTFAGLLWMVIRLLRPKEFTVVTIELPK